MASPRSKVESPQPPSAAAAAVTTSLPPKQTKPSSGQDLQEEQRQPERPRRRRFSSPPVSRSASPNPRRLSAPHSTVLADLSSDDDDDLLDPSFSPDSGASGGSSPHDTSDSAGRGGANAIGGGCQRRSHRHSSYPSEAAKDSGLVISGDSSSSSSSSSSRSSSGGDGGTRRRKEVVVAIDPDVVSVHGGAEVEVEAIGTLLRWTNKSKAGQEQQQQQGGGGSVRHDDEIAVDESSVSNTVCNVGNRNNSSSSGSLTLIIVPEDTNDALMTREISLSDEAGHSSGGCRRWEETIDRPGRFTYFVSAGPVTVGRVVVSEAPKKNRRGKRRAAAVKEGSPAPSPRRLSSFTSLSGIPAEFDSNEGDIGQGLRAVAVKRDDGIDHGPKIDTFPESSLASAKPNKELGAPALDVAGFALRTSAPSALCAPEGPTPPEGEARGSCPTRDEETESSDSDDDVVDPKRSTKLQEGGDLQQQQQQQQQQRKEQEEEAMAADELSPVSVTDRSQPTPSSAFSSPSRSNEAPSWQGGPASTEATTETETQEGPDETRMRAEVCAGSPGRLSPLTAQRGARSAALLASGGDDTAHDDADADEVGENVTGSQVSAEPDGSLLTSPGPVVHQPALVAEGSDSAQECGTGEEGKISNPTTGGTRAEDDLHDGKDSPTGYLTPTGDGEPVAPSSTEEEEQEVGGAAVEAEATKAVTIDEESEGTESEYDDPTGDGVSDSAAQGRGDVDEEGGGGAQCTSSGGSEMAERTTTQENRLVTTAASAAREGAGEVLATPSGLAGVTELDPLSRGGPGQVEVGVDESRTERPAVSRASKKEDNPVAGPCGSFGKEESEPLSQGQGGAALAELRESRPAITAAAAAAAAGAAAADFGEYSEIDSDDDPEGILSEDSGVDSDDGTPTSSKGTTEGACGDKLPISPEPLFFSASPPMLRPDTGTVGRGGGDGGKPMSPTGTCLEARITQYLPSLEIEPAASDSINQALKGVDGLPLQVWRAGISPLTSPAVPEGPSGGDVVGFRCSEVSGAVASPRDIADDHVPESKQGLFVPTSEAGIDCGTQEGNGFGEGSISKGVETVSSMVAAASVEVRDDNNDDRPAKQRAGIPCVEGGEGDSSFKPPRNDLSSVTAASEQGGAGEREGGALEKVGEAGDASVTSSGSSHEASIGGMDAGMAFSTARDSPCRPKAYSSCDAGGGTRSNSGDVADERRPTPSAEKALLTGIASESTGGGAATMIGTVGDDPAKARSVPVTSSRGLEETSNPSLENDEEKGEILMGGSGVGNQAQSGSDSDSFDPSDPSEGGFGSPPEDDEEKGEILVVGSQTQSGSDSDSFDPSDHSERSDYFQAISEERSSPRADEGSSGRSASEDEGLSKAGARSDAVQLARSKDSSPPLARSAGDERGESNDATHTDNDFLSLESLAAVAATEVGKQAAVLGGRPRNLPPLLGARATSSCRTGVFGGLGSRPLGATSVFGEENQRRSSDAAGRPERLSTAADVSPRRSYSSPDVLSTEGAARELGSRGEDGGIGGDYLKTDSCHGRLGTPSETPEVLLRAPRVNAAVQSGEFLFSPPSVFDKAALGGGKTGRESPSSVRERPIGAGGTGAVTAGDENGGRPREVERVAMEPRTTAPPKNKKKKSKKKKKKKRTTTSGGGDGNGRGEGGESGDEIDGGGGRDHNRGAAWGVRQGLNFDASKVGGGIENDRALLMDELNFSQRYPDLALGQGGKGSKWQAKTLIVGNEGFISSKPLIVEASAVVTMKVACVGRNARVGHAGVLNISLELPDPQNVTPQRCSESSHGGKTLSKTSAPGEAVLAVFHEPGEYFLKDGSHRKRLKVTVTERPQSWLQKGDAAANELFPSAAPTKRGGIGSASESGSLARKTESCNNAEGNGAGRDASATSSFRSKKKGKGKEKPSAAGVATNFTAAVTGMPADHFVAPSTEAKLSPTGLADRGTTQSPRAKTAAQQLLPAIRVKAGDDGLSLDELAEHNEFAKSCALGGVHVVSVSHQRGFEPCTLEVELTPGLGACVMCDLDSQQRVTQEVVCRRLVAGGNNQAGNGNAKGGLNEASRPPGMIPDGEDGEVNPNIKKARLGPGILNKCHFILGCVGEYRLSYPNATHRGLSVVVSPPLSMDRPAGGLPNADSVGKPLSTGDEGGPGDVLTRSSYGERDVSRGDERRGSGASMSSEEYSSCGGAKSGSASSSSPEPQPGYRAGFSCSGPNRAQKGSFVYDYPTEAASPAGVGFSSGYVPTDEDLGQGGFVHQRGQKKKNNQRLKRSSAAAAAAAATAAAASAAAAADEVSGWDQPRDTDTATSLLAAAAPSQDGWTGVAQQAPTTQHHQGGAARGVRSENTVVAHDDDDAVISTSSIRKTSIVQASTGASWFTDVPVEVADDWRVAAATQRPGRAVPEGSSFPPAPDVSCGNGESSAAKPSRRGGPMERIKSEARNAESARKSTSPVTRKAAARKTVERKAEVGKQKHRTPVHVGNSSANLSSATSIKGAPRTPTFTIGAAAKETLKRQEATGPSAEVEKTAGQVSTAKQGGCATEPSWQSKAGTAAQSQQHNSATSSAPGRDSPRSRKRNPRGECLSRHGRNPLAKVFTPPHLPQGRIEEVHAPFVRGTNSRDPGRGSAPLPSKGGAESGGGNSAHTGGERPSSSDQPAWTASPVVPQPAKETVSAAAAAAAAPGWVSSTASSSRFHPSTAEVTKCSRGSDEHAVANHSQDGSSSVGEQGAVGNGGWPRTHSVPGEISTRDPRFREGGGQDVDFPGGKARSSQKAGTPDNDRYRAATAPSSVPPESPSLLPTRSYTSGSTVAGSSDSIKSKGKKNKKAKVVERKAAERKAAAAAAAATSAALAAKSAGEEPTWPCSNATAATASNPSPSGLDSSRTRQQQQHTAARQSVGMAVGSSVEPQECGVGDVAVAEVPPTPVPSRPGSSFRNSSSRGETTANNHKPNVSRQQDASPSTTWSSSTGRVPDESAARKAAGVEDASNGGCFVADTPPVPRSANGGWTRERVGRGRGGAGKNGLATAAYEKPAYAAAVAAGGSDTVGQDEGVRERSRRAPPPGLPWSRGGAHGEWGGPTTAVVEAPAGGVTRAPAAPTPMQPQSHSFHPPPPPPPPPGFSGGRNLAARTSPRDDTKPTAATAARSATNPSATLTPSGGASTASNSVPPAAVTATAASVSTSAGRAKTSPLVASGSIAKHNPARQGGSSGRFGNCSTKVSYRERSRRNHVLRAGAAPFYPAARATRGGWGGRQAPPPGAARPAQFPEESRLPGGGYYIEERPEDILPPPTAYEVQEAARMMRVYDEMMERLRTTGMDEPLPNGFTPRIYDLTDGGW